jgi:crotonobetainyl-CoA:carnitine CoA-transferase CaiB-like acyl-CoA transferase
VAWRIYGGRLGAKTRALAEWADSEGQAGGLTKVNWEKVDYLSAAPKEFGSWESLFGKFFLTHTKAELCREALAKGIVLFPASTPKDLLEDPQLKARDYWTRVEHPELESAVIYPGPLYKSSEITWDIRRAPFIGEHNAEVYEKEMGFPKEELAILKHGGVI